MRRVVFIGMILALVFTFWTAGCYRSAPKEAPAPPVSPSPQSLPPQQPPEDGTAVPPATIGPTPAPPSGKTDGSTSQEISGVPSGEMTESPPSEEAPTKEVDGSLPPAEGSDGGTGRPSPSPAAPTDTVSSASHEALPLPENAPSFAREQEELVYRVEFLGLTMGYARFRFQGMVRIGETMAYHLTVRAWTSDLLAVFYPMNDTIEYYLDVETLAPIRQEFTNSRKEDDIAYYDQQTGKIVYRYKKNGKIRKQVEAVPGVYDPVSVVYYFRTRTLAGEEPPQQMYAGRKLWEVSAKPMNVETIRTEWGQFDTVMIEPVLRTAGKQEHRGNIRVWMTRDERHLPVRLYAKFKKIRTWRLVGELLPVRQGGES